MPRTALLIRCAPNEAEQIRYEAGLEHLTISAYVVRTTNRALISDLAFMRLRDRIISEKSVGPRTALLVRCSCEEADRIRDGAKRHHLRLNSFVLQAMKCGRTALPEIATSLPN